MKNEILYLRHILDAIGAIQSHIKGMDFGGFENDLKTFDAVVRRFEIIGEATRRISMDVRNRSPEIPWQMMVAMRNFLAHEYMNIKPRIIWKTASEQLPALEIQITGLIDKLSGN